ncbi:sterigmatocystin biosynthesis monooxygenase stcS like protein [Verticillium longisporum]|uniref:Sterigmatocystin biosynthesis monooxygenase stcS like protein n=1 Tax=Verticillium longisporum TaxID=100787 RepID=A0A8I2ZRV3_VERLO|nr:sterigmatocystin biosynthesis monooxygenase stcS like protein [Verticillium longisporum]
MIYDTNASVSSRRSLTQSLIRLSFLVLVIGFGYFVARLVQVRLKFRRLKAQGVPLMPHSFLTGHLHIIAKLTRGLPIDLHPNYISQLIYQNWRTLFPDRASCPGALYVDMWPIAPPLLFITDAHLANQFIVEPSLPRPPNAKKYLAPLTHNLDLVSLEGAPWKTWRSRFNPGFSAKNLTTLAPAILDEVATFADILREHAGTSEKPNSWGPVFQLETLTTNLTFDVIARAVLDISLNEQRAGPSVLKEALVDQLSLCMFDYNILTLPKMLSPRRHLSIARNTAAMRGVLLPAVERSLRPDSAKETTVRTIVDLAVKAIAKYPDVAERIRQEHVSVFGKTMHATREKIRQAPHLLNSLPYTLAVIKETLRIYPGPGGIRSGSADFFMTDPTNGMRFPTDGFMIWDGIRSKARAEEQWHRAGEFLPERWLVTDQEDALCPGKDSWRVFGLGPRHCIGQELALMELKLVVALVIREMDVECAWEEWDVQNGNAGPKEVYM